MKINQPSVSPHQKTVAPQEQQRKTQQRTAGVPHDEDDAVVMNVSQRKAIENSGVDGGEFGAESFSALKSMILNDPEGAVGAQSNSTPERVLQLLA